MNKKKYLVTGGTGFIGASLVQALVKDGHTVRIFDNQSRGKSRRIASLNTNDYAKNFEMIEGDIRDPEQVLKASKGMDSVIHLAFVNGTEFFYTKPELVLEVGVKGITNVIDSCLKHNIAELILASSSEVYQEAHKIPTDETVPLIIPDVHNPRYSYASAKLISEVMTINYGRKYFERAIIFRPHNVYGPDMGWEHVVPQIVLRLEEQIKEKLDSNKDIIDFPIQGTGKESRAFIYIDDFTEGLMTILKHAEHLGIYHIGTNLETTILELVDEIAKYFDCKLKIVPGELSKGSTPRRCPDISKLQKLGFQPKISLSQGIKLTADWYCQNSHLAPQAKETLNNKILVKQ